MNPYGYVDNPVKFVDPYGLEKCPPETLPAPKNLPTAKDLAEAKAADMRAGATSKTQLSKLPRTTSAAIYTSTGKVYYGVSGWPQPQIIHAKIEKRMPKPSLTDWDRVENCAEFRAVNAALLDGAKIKNLEVHTVFTKTGEAIKRCNNCRVTTAGTIVTSD